MNNHKYDSKKRLDQKLYKFIREHGGWGNWVYEELETRACWDWEVATVEREWVELYGATLNNNMPGRSHIESNRKYHTEHCDELKSKAKSYYAEHIDEIKSKSKSYYQKNCDVIKAKAHEKVTCPCGATVSRGGLWTHRQSKKHQRWEAENAD